jgi:hypothetical protein
MRESCAIVVGFADDKADRCKRSGSKKSAKKRDGEMLDTVIKNMSESLSRLNTVNQGESGESK